MKRFLKGMYVSLFLWSAGVASVLAQTNWEAKGNSLGLFDRLGKSYTVPQIINGIIKFALGIVGIYFLLVFIWGGLLWMTSAGSSERAKKARAKLTNSVIGIAIVVFAYMIIATVIKYSGQVLTTKV